jgi:hypothetical protein
MQGFPQVDDEQKDKTNQNSQEGIGGKNLEKCPTDLGGKCFDSKGDNSTAYINVKCLYIDRRGQDHSGEMHKSLQQAIGGVYGTREAIQNVHQKYNQNYHNC